MGKSTGLLKKLLLPDLVESEKKALNISKFFDKLKSFEVDNDDARIPAVVDWLELSQELGESPRAADSDWTEINAVNILTVHSSKGLEFPVVFLVNLVSQRFPPNERREQIPIPESLIKEVLPIGDYHLEEERRLFYVGMTRAKDRLFLTAADYYGEGKREKKLSPFVYEAIGEKAANSPQSTDYSKQLTFLDYEPAIDGSLKAVNRQKIKIDFLSYSQIEAFKTCPLHYKLKYLLHIPTLPSASQSFGITMHSAVRNFFEILKSKKDVEKSHKQLEKIILKSLEDNWQKEGFLSKSHERKFFEKGKLYLTGFLKTAFDKNKLPDLMEQKFLSLHLGMFYIYSKNVLHLHLLIHSLQMFLYLKHNHDFHCVKL